MTFDIESLEIKPDDILVFQDVSGARGSNTPPPPHGRLLWRFPSRRTEFAGLFVLVSKGLGQAQPRRLAAHGDLVDTGVRDRPPGDLADPDPGAEPKR